MSPDRVVFLFRSGDECDPYEVALAEAGYAGIPISVLDFEFVHSETLRAALEHPRSYDGMIFTSPRAVEAVASAMPWLPSENMLWHSKSVFAVGPRTAFELRRIGFEPVGESSGSADMLAEHISAIEFEKPLLFLCGNRRRDELPDRLRDAGIDMEELCVYETHPRTRLDLPDHLTPDWVVFFSPSGIDAVLADGRLDLSSTRIATIGSTTAASSPVPVHAVADSPTPDALVLAIVAADASIEE